MADLNRNDLEQITITVLAYGDLSKYSEGSMNWHQVIDISWLELGEQISLKALAGMHGTRIEHYIDIDQLEKDGLITIKI